MNQRKAKYFALVSLLIFLSGCATTRIAPETVSRLKRVGVISVTAQEFHRRYTGFTVFGNEREKQDISAWKVDDEYEIQMQTVLSKLGLFEAIRVQYDRTESIRFTMLTVHGTHQVSARSGLTSNSSSRISPKSIHWTPL